MIEYRRDPKNPRELKPAISAEQVERRRAHVRIAIADNRIEGIATSAATLEICEVHSRRDRSRRPGDGCGGPSGGRHHGTLFKSAATDRSLDIVGFWRQGE